MVRHGSRDDSGGDSAQPCAATSEDSLAAQPSTDEFQPITLPIELCEAIAAKTEYTAKFGRSPPMGLSRRYATGDREYAAVLRKAIAENDPFPPDDPGIQY